MTFIIYEGWFHRRCIAGLVCFIMIQHCVVLLGDDSTVKDSQKIFASGMSFSKDFISVYDTNGSVPASMTQDFLHSIDNIEKSQRVRVPFTKMSDWRRSRFSEYLRQWVDSFPTNEYRKEPAIIEGHSAQTLVQIAQLFVVPSLPVDSKLTEEANRQLKEIQELIRIGILAKFKKVSQQLTEKYPVLGADFEIPFTEIQNFFTFAVELDDDLNFCGKYPLEENGYKKLKSHISNELDNVSIVIPEISDAHLSNLRKYRDSNKDKEVHAILESISVSIGGKIKFDVRVALLNGLSSLITKDYTSAVPRDIVNRYQLYAGEISAMIDSSSVHKAFIARNKITQELNQKWVDDHKKEFDMIVASQPKEPIKPTIEIPPVATSRRIMIMIMFIINALVIAIFLYRYLTKKRKND